MINLKEVSLNFGKRVLFDNVNIKFTEGNCYGLIGANGSGKSTFLKLLSKELDVTKGEIAIDKNKRISFLKQDHNIYDDFNILEVVIMGNEKLYTIMKEKEILYSKTDFTDEDGIKLGNLEAEFMEMDGWQAESAASLLLDGLDVKETSKLMKEVDSKIKVKVLLAQALFGNPDILLLDEPTNGLDINAKIWLEEFLINFSNTVIVVSHDRHFLNKVCTYIVDIDYEKVSLFVGNYDFWRKSSELIQEQMKTSNVKKEKEMQELKDFIARFSANASKSKQATSRKKTLEKIVLEEIKPSSRKYPYINFKFEKKLSKEVITLKNINLTIDNKVVFKNLNLTINNFDKIAFLGEDEFRITMLFKLITGEIEADSGEVIINQSVKISYFPKNHDHFFVKEKNILEFLFDYSNIKEEQYVRGFLGRMLFSGEESLKKLNVLSGGEKVRVILSKMMLENGNFLILDEPTNHLDIEAISSLNESLIKFESALLLRTHDHELIETTCNRMIEFLPDNKYIDKMCTYNEYIEKKQN